MCDSIFEDKDFSEKDFTNEELIIIDLTLPLLKAAKNNYENGLKGGRPTKINYEKALELKDKGLNNSQIAEYFGVSKRAIEIFFQERKNEKTPEKTPKKSNDNDNVNLNDTYNDKETVYLNDKDKETEKENLNNNNNNNKFSIPTFYEVEDFAKKQKLALNVREFYDYYQGSNWENVYNWQRLIIKWDERQQNRKQKIDDPYAGLR